MIDQHTVFVVIYIFAEIPDVTIFILRVPIKGFFDQFAILED